MQRIILSLFLVLTAVGCGPRYVDFFPCHEDGRAKPAVILIPPLKSEVAKFLPWDSSAVILERVRYEMMCTGALFVYSEEDVAAGMQHLGEIGFFNCDEKFAQTYCDADFVVLMELVGYEFLPFQAAPRVNCVMISQPCDLTLNAKLRIKIVDLRKRCPQVVLQEIISNHYLLTNEECLLDPANYQTSSGWKAQQRWAAHIANRIEQVINCAY